MVRLGLICILLSGAYGFFEELFNDAFGGGGGGSFQFVGGSGFNTGHQQPKKIKFPKGVTSKIHDAFVWLKGTEWNWNSWAIVKFNSDGSFDAPTNECRMPLQCRWSASKSKVYIMWGQAGLHILEADTDVTRGLQATNGELKGVRLNGIRQRDGEKCYGDFQRIVDTELRDNEKDLYAALELDSDASVDQVKKTYRKLSIKYHPDKNRGDSSASEKFNAIREANEILADPMKKIMYDTGGMEAVRAAERGEVQKGNDVHVSFNVDLSHLYTGATKTAQFDRRVVCGGCRTNPGKPACRGCNRCPPEIKMVQQQVGPGFFVQQQKEVASKEKCKNDKADVELHIEAGMKDGDTIKFDNMAEQRPGSIPGDVIFVIKQNSNAKFQRVGDDLKTRIRIPLREALVGFKRYLQHLDGHEVTLDRMGMVTQPFSTLTIVGEGMPKRDVPSEKGDLFVEVLVDFPTKIEDSKKDSIAKLFTEDSGTSDEIRA